MKTSCLTQQLALTAVAIVIATFGHCSAQASTGGSWGGSLGGGSLGSGLAGGSWGTRGGFRTPVRDFFAYRQPVRNLLRGVASGLRASLTPRGSVGGGFANRGGFGSIGSGAGGYGSAGYGYGSTGVSYSQYSGGLGSGGYNYYGSAPAISGFMGGTPISTSVPMISSPVVSAPISSAAPAPMVAPTSSEFIGGSISSGMTPYGDSTYYGDSTILDSGSIPADSGILSSDPYYGGDSAIQNSGEDSVIDNTDVRGFETPPTPEPENGDTTTRRRDAILNVAVPVHAKVFVNDRLTKTVGENRSYVSRRLKIDRSYPFRVRAEIERDGETICLEKSVVLKGGDSHSIDFDFQSPILTQLTVKVPEKAKVKLCGNDTSAQGEVRNYKTRLVPGKVWQDYQVEVTVDVNGQEITQKKSITIKAGEKYVVNFLTSEDLYVSK